MLEMKETRVTENGFLGTLSKTPLHTETDDNLRHQKNHDVGYDEAIKVLVETHHVVIYSHEDNRHDDKNGQLGYL
jgi:hypothetical protein